MRFLPRPFLLLSTMLLPLTAAAQMHRVDKPEQVTRAVGVYEWTGELNKPGQARLVPVSLFISGRYQAAGTYLARPVPLALDTGNVYSIERAGHSLGVLDVNLARDVATARSQADDNPEGAWYGYGLFAVPSAPKAKALQPVKDVGKIAGTQDDDRPHFVPSRQQSDQPAASTPGTSGKSTGDAGETERPTLGRRSDSSATTVDTADNGKEKKPKREKPQGYVTGVGNGLNDDPDRPTLGHSKGQPDAVAPLEGLPAGMHQAIAVSDPAVRDEHVFTREWDSGSEHAEVLAKMRALAEEKVRSYLQQNALAPSRPAAAKASDSDTAAPPKLVRTPHGVSTSTKAPAATAKKGAKTPPPVPLVLAGEQLSGYNLSYGGLPVFVYTAAVPATPAQARSADVKVYVAVVAQQLPSGEIQVALSSVTDSGHMDRTPWMRFVDVVDADGSHRASLLFEMRQAHARQFALYRLVSAEAEQIFVTPLIE